jgi:ubiquinone/menaquinone biosynthesis C-methylase UbiE
MSVDWRRGRDFCQPNVWASLDTFRALGKQRSDLQYDPLSVGPGGYHRGVPTRSGRRRIEADSSPVYALGSGPEERQRLLRQADELLAVSSELLSHTRLGAGDTAIDLGCGPRGILDLLAARVGPAGRVVGLDFDAANVALAQAYALEHGLSNVQVITGDAGNTGLPDSSFDVVHARTLLINVPDPAAVVTEMVRLARPDGGVVAMEPDIPLTVCYPRLEAWERMSQLFAQSYARDRADDAVGRRLSELFRNAGLVDIGTEAHMTVYPPGHSRRTVRPDLFRTLRSKIVARGMADDAELAEIDRAVRTHLADPHTLIAHTSFTAWGRKPAVYT